MFSSISWQQYGIFLLLANAVYYLFVWIVLYKASLSFLTGTGKLRNFSLPAEDVPDELMTTVQQVIAELRPLFRGQRNQHELLFALQLHLKKYRDWEEPGFRDLVNQFIAEQSETLCSIRLGEEEIRALWKQA